MARVIRLRVLCAAALMIAGNEPVPAQQRCPPNSHPEAVAIPGNLRTAQCFCDPGFINANGVCVRPPEAPQRNEPVPSNPAPKPFR